MSRARGPTVIKNKALVDEYIRHGSRAMQEKDYEAARENFDKAINFGGRDISLLDYQIRPLIFMKEWHITAYEITKHMIEKWPQDHRGYFRRAMLLGRMHRFDPALKCIEQAIKLGPTRAVDQRTSETLQKCRGDLVIAQEGAAQRGLISKEQHRARQAAIRKSRINFAHRLSADIIITIVEQGLAEQPGLAVKMSGVCRSWREIIIHQGSLWNTLVLNEKKPVEKTKLWMERSNGRLHELILTLPGNLEQVKLAEIGRLLIPSLDNLRYLSSVDRATLPWQHVWQERCRSLRYLQLIGGAGCPWLDGGLLHSQARSLRELHLEHREIYARPRESASDPDSGSSTFTWTDHDEGQLLALEVITMKQCGISSTYVDQSDLLQDLLSLRSVSLVGTTWSLLGVEQQPSQVVLHDLSRYELSSSRQPTQAPRLEAPNLRHLDLWSVSFYQSTVPGFITSSGLERALPHLESLDMGRCAVTLEQLLPILSKLPSLKFLNVSFCSLDNRFLESLERRNKEDDLLPNLTALSVAGNSEITAGPLRRLVDSRTPEGVRALSRSSSVAMTPARGSAFRPTLSSSQSKSSPFGPSQPKSRSSQPATGSRAPSQTSATSSQPKTQSSQASAISSPSTQHKPCIQWLVIDHCERIEAEAFDYLRKRVRFVTQSFSAKMDENRIRGKGRYAWDAAYTPTCGDACSLRRVPGSKDGYYVHHTCEAELWENVGEPSWTQSPSSQLGQTQPSQPASSQAGPSSSGARF
ncbi:hypothetical protein IAU60_002959 [Kwoniella sp. DSM 27419]